MSRRGRQRRHHKQEGTKSRVPIIPMLDMAFQLLAFGLSTFDLSNIYEEGQLSMSLPQSGSDAPAPASPELDKETEDFTLMVTADTNGGISEITYTTTKQKETNPLSKQLHKANKDDARPNLEDQLIALVKAKEGEGKPTPKLDAQFEADLQYQLVFDVLSTADAAKFKKVTPMMLVEKKAEPKTP